MQKCGLLKFALTQCDTTFMILNIVMMKAMKKLLLMVDNGPTKNQIEYFSKNLQCSFA